MHSKGVEPVTLGSERLSGSKQGCGDKTIYGGYLYHKAVETLSQFRTRTGGEIDWTERYRLAEDFRRDITPLPTARLTHRTRRPKRRRRPVPNR